MSRISVKSTFWFSQLTEKTITNDFFFAELKCLIEVSSHLATCDTIVLEVSENGEKKWNTF